MVVDAETGHRLRPWFNSRPGLHVFIPSTTPCNRFHNSSDLIPPLGIEPTRTETDDKEQIRTVRSVLFDGCIVAI